MSADELPARGVGCGIAADQVRDRTGRGVGAGQTHPAGTGLTGHKSQLTGQVTDQLPARSDPASGECGVQPAIAVGRIGPDELVSDQGFEDVAAPGGGGVRAGSPRIEPGRGHLQPAAHRRDRKRAFGSGERCVDELVLLAHRGSWAKYAAAFFRNSFSSFTSRYLRSSSRSRARSLTSRPGSSPTWSRR